MHPRTHRIFDGAGERLGAKFLMRIGSTCAAIEPFGSVSLLEYGLSISAMPFGTCDQRAMARLAFLSAPEFESSLSQVRFALDG